MNPDEFQMSCVDCARMLGHIPPKLWDNLPVCDACFRERLLVRAGLRKPLLPCPYQRPDRRPTLRERI